MTGDAIRAIVDADMLRAALLNLAMNACQAAETNDVSVEVAADRQVCRIVIADRGPGIGGDDSRPGAFRRAS